MNSSDIFRVHEYHRLFLKKTPKERSRTIYSFIFYIILAFCSAIFVFWQVAVSLCCIVLW